MIDSQDVLVVWIAAAVAMFLAWLLQLFTRNAGLVDAVWASCLSASALFYAGTGHGGIVARAAVAVLGGFWGCRLCLHILARVLTEHEDGRYRHLRERWQGNPFKFFLLFQAQAVAVVLFSLPLHAAAQGPADVMTPAVAAGIAIWIVGLCGETLADYQLARFRRDVRNRGKTCRSGLWRYSRHPNYFFEWLHWFAYIFIAAGAYNAALAWLGPLLMLVALRWISGIPHTEAQALRSRGEDYRAYQRETSVFVPWFTRRGRT